MFTLKLVVYKKKACIYLVGGTKDPVSTFNKEANYLEIANDLSFKYIPSFWYNFGGVLHKGKLHEVTTLREASKLIEKLIKENSNEKH